MKVLQNQTKKIIQMSNNDDVENEDEEEDDKFVINLGIKSFDFKYN